MYAANSTSQSFYSFFFFAFILIYLIALRKQTKFSLSLLLDINSLNVEFNEQRLNLENVVIFISVECRNGAAFYCVVECE